MQAVILCLAQLFVVIFIAVLVAVVAFPKQIKDIHDAKKRL